MALCTNDTEHWFLFYTYDYVLKVLLNFASKSSLFFNLIYKWYTTKIKLIVFM